MAFTLISLSCSNSNENKDIKPTYDQTGKLKLLQWDSDHDGKVDTVAYMNGAKFVRIEIDKDEDGKVDRWEYYDDATQKLTKVGTSSANDGVEDTWSYLAPDGSVTRVDSSLKRDGKATRSEYFVNGSLVRAEEDSDEDGVVDKWEMYDNGRLAIVSMDTDHVGHPNHRLVYSADGTVTAEADPDGSGHWQPPSLTVPKKR